MITADFAPSSLPSAQRIRFLARHLPEFGWNPVLITTDPRYYESAVDPENEMLVPESLTVIRTPAIGIRQARRFGLGDRGMRSLYHHWRSVAGSVRTRMWIWYSLPFLLAFQWCW